MNHLKRKLIALFILVGFLTVTVTGQNEKVPSLTEIWQQFAFRSQHAGINFMEDGKHYTEKAASKDGHQLIVQYAIESGQPTDTLFNSKWVIEQQDTLSHFSFQRYSFSPKGSYILLKNGIERIYRYSTRENTYVWNMKEQELIPLSEKAKQRYATFSPNEKKIAFIQDNDIHIKDLKTRKITEVTEDGNKNEIINGATDWVHEEEFSFTKAFFWSPDNQKIAYYKFNESHVRQFSMPMYRGLYPKDYTFKYPKAGERNALVSLHVYHLSNEKQVRVDIGLGQKQFSDVYDFDKINETWEYIPRIKWTQDPSRLAIQRMNRHQSRLDFLITEANTGETELLFTEKSETYISVTDNLTFLENGKHFIWTSEKSGYNHIYLYNMQGEEVRQITEGNWPVTKFYGVDEKSKTIYFQAPGPSPMQRHVYKINLDGSGQEKLTQTAGSHSFKFDPSYSYYLHSRSDANTPPKISLHKINGEQIRMMEDNEKLNEKLAQYNLTKKEFFSFKTEEGVKLNGWMMKPPDFEPKKEYPVLMYVYGGPGSQTVRHNWGGVNYMWYQHLVNKGYIVVSVDNRGTGARGASFKKMTYKELGKYETKDQIAAAKYLATQDYVDEDRIGIWGWSYGGYMSSLCITKGAEVFSLAMAVAPATNWRFYDTIYTERFMQTPQENADGYDDNSPIHFVDSLKGNYLLVHGTADDNVHFQHTTEMVNALVAANKQFELSIYPNRNHSIFGNNARIHLFTKMTNFLLENL